MTPAAAGQPLTVADLQARWLRHPDLFTPEEAAAYLHLDSVRGLETLRKDYGLVGHAGVNKSYLYHREDLDRCALRICGKDVAWHRQNGGGGLKLTGTRP
jgi:hypothetical protein